MTLPLATVLKKSGETGTVLLHGMMMSPAIWTDTTLASHLEGRVVAYALPAHPTWELDADGIRPLLGIGPLVEAYAKAIERDLGKEPVDIVGHSTGGFLALLIAAHRPDLVRRLVLISGFADGAMDSRQPLPMRITCLPYVGSLAFRGGVSLGVSSRRLFVAASIRSINTKRFDARRSRFCDTLDRVRLELAKCDLRALALFIRWVSSTSLAADLRRIEAPVLLIAGSNDPAVPFSHQLDLAGRLRLCQSLVLDGVGHLPMVEAEPCTSRAVGAWLGSRRRDRAGLLRKKALPRLPAGDAPALVQRGFEGGTASGI